MKLIKQVHFTDDAEAIGAARCEVFEQVERIAARGHAWTKGSYAANQEGISLHGEEDASFESVVRPAAARFCAVGLLARARAELALPIPNRESDFPEVQVVEQILRGQLGEDDSWMSVTDYNDADKTTKQDILKLFRKAKERICPDTP